jgi:16S rRNA (guanine1516-N2)-methyltransferase
MSRFQLIHGPTGYQLQDQASLQKPLLIDFNAGALQYRRNHGGKKELLLKAISAKPGQQVIDCTAGLGVDAFLMAASGCTVTLLERSPVLALLLADGLSRGREGPETQSIVARMALVQTDAIEWLGRLEKPADTIYIDQMFPHRQKSAAVKGGMQLLQKFLGDDGHVADLLAAALATNSRRVVVKRPLVGGDSEGMAPHYQLKAKASRFDIYLQNPATH